jgi:hypothetical protein
MNWRRYRSDVASSQGHNRLSLSRLSISSLYLQPQQPRVSQGLAALQRTTTETKDSLRNKYLVGAGARLLSSTRHPCMGASLTSQCFGQVETHVVSRIDGGERDGQQQQRGGALQFRLGRRVGEGGPAGTGAAWWACGVHVWDSATSRTLTQRLC